MRKSAFQFFVLSVLLLPQFVVSQYDFSPVNAKIDKVISQFVVNHDIPGVAISISYYDTLIYSKGFGYANIKKQQPVIPSQSQFRIGSVTKSITALTLGKLSQQGKLNLDASIYNYLDSLPKKEYEFTVKQVGGHTAGLKRMYLSYNTDSLNVVTRRQLYNAFTGQLLFKPGTQHLYSNFGFELLGIVIENVHKVNFDKAVEQLVLDPLKMKHTGPMPDTSSNTKYYTKKENAKIDALYMGHNVNTASGYYYATSEDIVKLGNALLFPDRLVSKEILLKLIKPQKLTTGKATGYGIGVETLADSNGKWSYGHSGHIYGGTSFYGVTPGYKYVIAILINCDYLKEGKINELAQKISAEYFKVIKHQP
jgi:serine beta-lactamase-like protein LACTB